MTVLLVFMEANKTAANCTIVPASVTAYKHIVLHNGNGGDMHVGLSLCNAHHNDVMDNIQSGE